MDRGHEASDELGHLDLGGIGCAEGGPVFEGGGDGGFNDRVVVAVDGWAPGADEVDEFTVVGGDERGAARSLHEERRAADGAESADGELTPPGMSWRARVKRVSEVRAGMG